MLNMHNIQKEKNIVAIAVGGWCKKRRYNAIQTKESK